MLESGILGFLADFAGQDIAYRLKCQILSAIGEFVGHAEIRGAEEFALVRNLLLFVMANASGDVGLCCVAIWALSEVRFRLIGLGREEDWEMVFWDEAVRDFITECEEMDVEELWVALDGIDRFDKTVIEKATETEQELERLHAEQQQQAEDEREIEAVEDPAPRPRIRFVFGGMKTPTLG
jgi:hypothetical protein